MCFIIFFVWYCVVCRGRIGMSDTMIIKQWLAWSSRPSYDFQSSNNQSQLTNNCLRATLPVSCDHTGTIKN